MISYKSTRTEEVFPFDDGVTYLNSLELAGWKWDSTSLNGRSRYSRNAQDMKAVVSFLNADSAAKFMATIDADTEAGVEGILTVNDWAIRGNISAGSLAWKTSDGKYAQYGITFHADYPIWFNQIGTWSFPPSTPASGGLDYPYDYPYDFAPPLSGTKTITVDSLRPCEFEMVIYGAVDNPAVTINGIKHEVDCSVPAGSLLFINTMNAKLGADAYGSVIFLRDSAGNITNEYSKQSRVNDVLARVQPGENLVTWNGSFGFDLTLYETRGIRPWM